MKKSLLAFGAACIALSSMAAIPKHPFNPSPLNYDRNATVQPLGNLHVGSAPSKMKKAPAKVGSPEDIITSAEGTRQDLTLTGSGYIVFWGYLIQYENESTAGHIIYGDNDEVYIYNIIPNAATDTYVKGVKNGDKIEVSLPQTVTWFDGDPYGYNLCLLEKDEEESSEEEGNWYIQSDATSVSFTVAEDGTIVAEGLSEDLILGFAYTDDESWSGYGVYELSMAPFYEKVVEVPTDIEVSKNFWSYYCEDLGYGWPVSWAQGYDEFYFQGLSYEMPEAWIKGSVEYDDSEAIISIPTNQYVGVYYGYYIYTKAVRLFYDEDSGDEDFEIMPDDYKYQLVWDYEENTITPKDPEIVFVYNIGNDELAGLSLLYDFSLIHQDSYAGTPQNPFDLVFVDFMDDYGQYDLYFNVPAFSTEGDVLLTENLSYIIYIDEDEWTFDANEYWLTEDMVEIPWSFNSSYIIVNEGIARQIAFFVEGISTIGVQSVYNYHGEETRSEIVTLDLDDTTAAGHINADKKVASVKYYDVTGREVANPAGGLVIKRVVYDDGTVASFKKMAR
ncbi:MAG: hypothetical protein K2N35_04365 [Muribaculaceae bacterium]|nr:hypothetical protein [Muribaculaceae bacterium]